MTFLSILVTISGTIMGFSFFPQTYKIFKRKSAEDISILTYFVLLIGATIWILYGIELKDSPLIIANSVGVLNILLVIIGCSLYKKHNKKEKK